MLMQLNKKVTTYFVLSSFHKILIRHKSTTLVTEGGIDGVVRVSQFPKEDEMQIETGACW